MEILQSKLLIPEPAPYIVDRSRLSEKIISSDNANLFLLIAAAGYGKSTVAQQVLMQLPGSRKAWLHLESHDSQSDRFMLYFLECLGESIQAFKDNNLSKKLIAGKAKAIEIAEDICFLLQEYKGPVIWLVLDNWEAVNDSRDINSIILTIAKHTKNNFKIIINSRVKPSFKFRKIQESGRALVIDQSELAFTFPEFVEAFEKRIKTPVAEDELEKLWKITAGWCVNLGLILEMIHQKGSRYGANMTEDIIESDSLSDYLREELLGELSSEFLDFIIRCSVLDLISPESCGILFDDDELIERNIKALSQSSIPLFKLPEKQNYRLHPVIRQEANRILRDKYDSDEIDDIYLKASEYYVSRGAIIEALELLIDYEDYDAALKLIDKQWYKIIDLNGLPAVRQWLNRFPSEIQKRPLYVKTMTNLLCIFGYNQELVDFLSQKLNPDDYEKGDPILCMLWVRLNWAKLHTIDEPQYEKIAKDWEVLNKQKGPFPESSLSGVELTISCAAYNELRINEALEHNNNSIKYIGKDSDAYRLSVSDNNALFLNMLGRSHEGIEILENNIKKGDKLGVYNGRAHRLISIGWIYGSIGDYDKAIEKIDDGMETMYKYDLHNVRDHMYADRYAGQALWYSGDKEEALRRLENSFNYAKDHNQKEALVTGLLIEYYSMLDGITKKLVQKDQIPGKGARSSTRMMYSVICAYTAIQEGAYEKALKYMKELHTTARNGGLIPWQIAAELFYAYIFDMKGDVDFSKKHLVSGLALLEKINWATYQMSNDTIDNFVYVKSLRYDINPKRAMRLARNINKVILAEAVQYEIDNGNCGNDELYNLLDAAVNLKIRGLHHQIDLLRRSKIRKLAAAADRYITEIKEEPLPPLFVRSFGGFNIISNNRPISFKRKKSRLLCLLLLADYPKQINEEVLMETLWPDGDPVKSRQNLQTCVKDLRKDLDPFYQPRGDSYIVYENQHYQIVLPEGSNIDFIEFSKKAKSSLADIKSDELTLTQQSEIRAALKIYRGEFLPQERYEPYTIELREYLQKRFFDLAQIYVRWLLAEGQMDTAIEIVENGLQYDRFWSDGVQLLMEARVKNGELIKAMRVYRDYEKGLDDELGLPPDEEMIHYFENLVNQYNK